MEDERDRCRMSAVTSRDTVHLIARYALLPANRNEEIKVTERWQITHDGEVVGTPVITMTRTGGTWSPPCRCGCRRLPMMVFIALRSRSKPPAWSIRDRPPSG